MGMYNQPTLFILFIFELLMLIVSICLVIYLRFRLSGEIVLPLEHVGKGKPISIEIHLKNPTLIPVMRLGVVLRYTYRFSSKWHNMSIVGSIDSKDKAVFKYEVISEYCGCLDFDIARLKIYGIFNLLPVTKRLGAGFQVAILPNIYETNIIIGSRTRNLVGESDLYSKNKSGDDPSEVFKIREYLRGDKLQNIHWKITARRDVTMVKEFSQPIGFNVVLLMDINRKHLTDNSLMTMDRFLESAISIASGLLEADCFFYLGWVDADHSGIVRRQIDSMDTLYGVMEEVIHLNIYSYEKDIIDIYKEVYAFSEQKTWLVIDAELNIYVNGTKEYGIGDESLKESLAGLQLVI